MFPQFICILDPSFLLEERFFLRVQFQQSAIEVDSTRRRFDFVVEGHDRWLMDLQEFCDRQALGWGVDFINRTTAMLRRLFRKRPAIGGFSAVRASEGEADAHPRRVHPESPTFLSRRPRPH